MKYVVLIASVLMQSCIGGLYAWSEFVPELTKAHGLSTAQTQSIFGSLIAVFTVSMDVAGRLMNRVGPRWIAVVGGFAFGGGYWIASQSGGGFGLLLLGVGIVTGIGTGFCYVCPLIMCAKWFPERIGLVTGLAVAGFGSGAIVLSNLGEFLFSRGMEVLDIFRSIGMLYGIVIVVAALTFHVPGRKTSGFPPIEFDVIKRDRYFWGLALGMFAGTFAGLIVIGNLKPMLLSTGISHSTATIAISTFAIGNTFGRISWGWATDRFGATVIPVSLTFLAVMVLLTWLFMGSPTGALVFSFMLGAGFGACFVVYAAQTASHFGENHLASIYPLVFLFYGLSGLIGPWINGWIYDHVQSYSGTLALSLGTLLVSIPGSLWLLRIPVIERNS